MSREPTDLSRREFVRAGSLLVASAAVGSGALGKEPEVQPIPRKVLGKTGARVTILGLGTAPMGHRNRNRPDLPPLIQVFSEAIDRGINYVDTSRVYGRAEEALGEVLKTRRQKIFLASKVMADSYEGAERVFEESMKWLKVEHLDLLHLHSAGTKNVDRVLDEKKGAWAFLRKMKEKGRTRFLGLSGHNRPANFVRIMEETGEVDVIMVAMNFVDRHIYGFEDRVLPLARKQGVGVMAMKVYGGIRGSFRNYGAVNPHPAQMDGSLLPDAIRYALSLEGVTGMVIGPHNMDQLRSTIQMVLAAKPLSEEEMRKLLERGRPLAREWGPRFGQVN